MYNSYSINSLHDLESYLTSVGLIVQRNPPVYGEGLLTYEANEGPQGLTIINDAVFVFTESERWGVWWVGRDRIRPAPQHDSLSTAVASVASDNQWSVEISKLS